MAKTAKPKPKTTRGSAAKTASKRSAAPKTGAKRAPKQSAPAAAAPGLIDRRIAELGDWRGEVLARMRALIREADPEIVEEWKWSVPVWSRGGIICTGESYRNAVKLTFAKGASLADPSGLFNSSLEGNVRRAIDIGKGQRVDARAFKALVKAAIAHNLATGAGTQRKPAAKAKAMPAPRAKKVVLLSGGNPQIAKADGDAPVQAFIAAMPGWKSAVGRRLDTLIVKALPNVRKAVKWNTPFYGVEGNGWFLGFHVYARYVKVAFLHGASLDPMPPGPSKDKNTRYLDIYEGDAIDEAQFARWVQQSAARPGFWPTT